jgi:hypothetical protein
MVRSVVMRVDVQLDDSELALLAGYNRSTTMGIKKPGELQRELLSDMENVEEKREVKAVPEEQGKDEDTKEAASALEDEAEEVKSAPVRVRSDFLSMLSAMAQPNTHEDKDSEDSEVEAEDMGILPEDNEDEDEEDGSVLPEDEDEEDGSVLPEDEDEEDGSVLPEDEDEEDGSVLPEDEDEEDGSTLPDDDDEYDEDDGILPADEDEYDEDDGILPADDEDAEGESVASEEPTAGITEQQEDEYSSELSEDDDDEEYSSELPEDEDDEEDPSEFPADEDDEEDSSVLPDDDEVDYSVLPDDDSEEDSSVLPDDEDEEGYSVLPDDEDEEEDSSVLPDDEDEEEDSSVLPDDEDEEEDSSVLPDDGDGEEVEDEASSAGIPETCQERTIHDVEKPVSLHHKVQKSKKPAVHHSAPRPSGYFAPSVPLYDFILNNGGSMLIEDVRKYYPIDEVKKALSLGKIYRFGNHVGV